MMEIDEEGEDAGLVLYHGEQWKDPVAEEDTSMSLVSKDWEEEQKRKIRKFVKENLRLASLEKAHLKRTTYTGPVLGRKIHECFFKTHQTRQTVAKVWLTKFALSTCESSAITEFMLFVNKIIESVCLQRITFSISNTTIAFSDRECLQFQVNNTVRSGDCSAECMLLYLQLIKYQRDPKNEVAFKTRTKGNYNEQIFTYSDFSYMSDIDWNLSNPATMLLELCHFVHHDKEWKNFRVLFHSCLSDMHEKLKKISPWPILCLLNWTNQKFVGTDLGKRKGYMSFKDLATKFTDARERNKFEMHWKNKLL